MYVSQHLKCPRKFPSPSCYKAVVSNNGCTLKSPGELAVVSADNLGHTPKQLIRITEGGTPGSASLKLPGLLLCRAKVDKDSSQGSAGILALLGEHYSL